MSTSIYYEFIFWVIAVLWFHQIRGLGLIVFAKISEAAEAIKNLSDKLHFHYLQLFRVGQFCIDVGYIRIYSKPHHPNILYGLIKKKRFRPAINADGSVTQGPDLYNKIMS